MLPILRRFPPDGTSYHSSDPSEALALRIAAVPAQMVAPWAIGAGTVFTVIVTGVLSLIQPFRLVSTYTVVVAVKVAVLYCAVLASRFPPVLESYHA